MKSSTEKKSRILRNAVRCRKCNTVVESQHVHDFVTCECGAIFTDGGREYIRRGGDLSLLEELDELIEEESK